MSLKDGARAERGAGLVETALVIPLLLLVLGGVIDMGRWLEAHLTTSRIAYEAARYGAVLPELEAGSSVNGQSETNAEGTPAPPRPVHAQLFGRIAKIIATQNLQTFTVRVTRTQDTPSMVRVTVSLPFTSLLLKYSGLQSVSSTASAPYLYREES